VGAAQQVVELRLSFSAHVRFGENVGHPSNPSDAVVTLAHSLIAQLSLGSAPPFVSSLRFY
jgi:hypothetical protein